MNILFNSEYALVYGKFKLEKEFPNSEARL